MNANKYQTLRAELAAADAEEAERVVEIADPAKDQALLASLLSDIGGPEPRPSENIDTNPAKPSLTARPAWFMQLAVGIRRQPALAVSAVAVLIAVLLPLELNRRWSTETPSQVVAYKLRVDGDEPEAGGPPLPSGAAGTSSDRATLSIDSRLEIILRPAEPVRNDVVIHSFVRRGTSVESWNVDLERSPSGVFSLRGPVRELRPLAPGHWELFFVIGYPDFVPTKDKLVQLLNADPKDGPRPGWQLIRGEVDILPTQAPR